MSLTTEPSYSIRPEDKAYENLYQSNEDPLTSSFDQYFNDDLFEDGGDKDKDCGLLGGIIDLPVDTSARISPAIHAPKRSAASPQPWRKGPWCLYQSETTSSRLHVEKQRGQVQKLQHAQTLPRKLASQVAAFLHTDISKSHSPRGFERSPSPSDFPPSPSPKKTKHLLVDPETVTMMRSQRPAPIRTVTGSNPSPVRHYQDTQWQEDFKNLSNIHQDDAFPLSPPPSGRPFQGFQAANVAAQQQMLQNGAAISGLNIQTTRNDQPYFDGFLGPNPYMYSDDSGHHSQEDLALLSPTSEDPSPSFNLDSFTSSAADDYSGYNVNSEFDPNFPHQPYWASPPPSAGLSAPTEYSYQGHIAAPVPQRPSQAIVHSPNFQNGGLMIQGYPDAHMSTVDPSHYDDHPGSAMSMHAAFSPTHANFPTVTPQQSDPNLHEAHNLGIRHPAFTQHDPFGNPAQPRFPVSPSRSPSTSPSHSSLRARRQPSLSPMKSLENLKTRRNLTPHHNGISKVPRTPKTPRTPTGGFGQIDFVNFTPKDSVKLLSDVAPSGSSKTRARREQEAKEKRRKLSEAALRAVKEAGGDVKALDDVL